MDETRKRAVAERLKRIHLQLQIVQAGIVVAVAALRHQHAESDEEIARVLRYCVGERLYAQIERTAELIASLQAFPSEGDWDLERGTDG